MSTESPGKSSTRDGLRLTAECSLLVESKDPGLRVSFCLWELMGGRILLPGWRTSIFQNIRWLRWPQLVSLKKYLHRLWLKKHIKRTNESLDTVPVTHLWVVDLVFYLKYVPRSRLGPKGLSLMIVVPVPVADTETMSVVLSCMDTSNLSWKWIVSFRCATIFMSNWLSGRISPSQGSACQNDLWLSCKKNRNTVWTWWGKVLHYVFWNTCCSITETWCI